MPWNHGNAAMYHVDPPMQHRVSCSDCTHVDSINPCPEECPTTESKYVVASKAMGWGSGVEVLIFPADDDGNDVTRMSEIGGGRGIYTHEQAFDMHGYEVIRPDEA
jgi:hypothetical protein